MISISQLGFAFPASEFRLSIDELKINALPVTDGDGRLVGAINMHDLLRAGVA